MVLELSLGNHTRRENVLELKQEIKQVQETFP